MEYNFAGRAIVNVCCDKCGSDDVAIPNAEQSLDPIPCNACGADNGSLALLDQQIEAQIAHQQGDDLGSSVADMFKGSPNVRVIKD